MNLIPEDPIKRCGVWFLSTTWIWKIIYKVGLARRPQDPYIAACEYDDKLTDSKIPSSNVLSNEQELVLVDAEIDKINKEVKRPKTAAFYKGMLHYFRKYFDK